jgi:hypothetical protein
MPAARKPHTTNNHRAPRVVVAHQKFCLRRYIFAFGISPRPKAQTATKRN